MEKTVRAGEFNEKEFKVACLKHDVSQEKLADLLGISYATLRRCVKNGGEFTRSQIKVLCTLFGQDTAMAFLFSV